MAVLLQVRDACKSYGDQTLLDGANATLTDDVKVGFVGRNGAGKSTLLRVILGEDDLDSGEIVLSPKVRIGYLRQHDPFQPGESALDFLIRDSEQPDWKCGEIAGQFELKGQYLEGPVSELSGGWQTRVKLAALLLHEPNLLLLDEPTNFLDLRTQILLEHFLRGFRQACLIVSHDREFLKRTCTETLDITRGKLTMYPGKVDAFLDYQAERKDHDQRANAAIVSKQKQLQRFIDKNRAGANTASQARSKAKQLERLKLNEIETEEATAYIRAPIVSPRQGYAVRCQALDIGYPDNTVASEITLEIEHGERTAIVGDNGQGKTTFLRTLVGSLEARKGEIKWGHGCDIGTYAQHVYSQLPEKLTVLEYLERTALPGTTNQEILAQAGALLFRNAHVHKKISVLSGGERARLCLAGLLLGRSNILVLDEPGNHLDVETVDALTDALHKYKGTVMFTSHDRHFVSRAATTVIEVKDGRARYYTGNYESYLYAINKEIDDSENLRNDARGQKKNKKSGGNSNNVKKRDPKKIRKELTAVETKIAKLEEEKNSLDSQLLTTTNPEYALKLHTQTEELATQLARAEEKWCNLQEKLEKAI